MGEIGYGPVERVDGPLPVAPQYGLIQAAAAPAAGVRIIVETADGTLEDLNDLSSTGETMDAAIARLKQEGVLPSTVVAAERWMNGVEVYPYPPETGAGVWDTCGVSNLDTAGEKRVGGDLPHPQFSPTTLYLAETCTSYKVWDQAAFKARAVLGLAAIQSSLLARQFMFGEANVDSPHLADGNANTLYPNGTSATNPMNALALCEGAIASTGKFGLIHCSPQFASALRDRFQIDDRGGVIRTINGNVVIPDAGYAYWRQGPHGQNVNPTGTQEWIYATGPVDIRMSELFTMPDEVSQALDRGTPDSATTGRSNSITYRAERYALALWDTELQAAVLADRCLTGCTG